MVTRPQSSRVSTAIPRELWPPVAEVHLAFQVMVAIGAWLSFLAVWAAALWWRGRLFESRPFLSASFFSSTLGFIAVEAGWMVTELGRQPWIVQGVMRTSDAVTPMPGLVVPFVVFTIIYFGLGAVVVALIRRTGTRDSASRNYAVIDPVVLLSFVLIVSLTAYALLGGADYGGGVWDLLATGPTAERQRATIAHAIGPVWEANHVWLIVAIVIVFTGFPRAFAEMGTYPSCAAAARADRDRAARIGICVSRVRPRDPRFGRFWGRCLTARAPQHRFFSA